MKKLSLLLFFIALTPQIAISKDTYSVDKWSCSTVDGEIERIESQMRAGYTAQ